MKRKVQGCNDSPSGQLSQALLPCLHHPPPLHVEHVKPLQNWFLGQPVMRHKVRLLVSGWRAVMVRLSAGA
jgi:hypothetical protein